MINTTIGIPESVGSQYSLSISFKGFQTNQMISTEPQSLQQEYVSTVLKKLQEIYQASSLEMSPWDFLNRYLLFFTMAYRALPSDRQGAHDASRSIFDKVYRQIIRYANGTHYSRKFPSQPFVALMLDSEGSRYNRPEHLVNTRHSHGVLLMNEAVREKLEAKLIKIPGRLSQSGNQIYLVNIRNPLISMFHATRFNPDQGLAKLVEYAGKAAVDEFDFWPSLDRKDKQQDHWSLYLEGQGVSYQSATRPKTVPFLEPMHPQ